MHQSSTSLTAVQGANFIIYLAGNRLQAGSSINSLNFFRSGRGWGKRGRWEADLCGPSNPAELHLGPGDPGRSNPSRGYCTLSSSRSREGLGTARLGGIHPVQEQVDEGDDCAGLPRGQLLPLELPLAGSEHPSALLPCVWVGLRA